MLIANSSKVRRSYRVSDSAFFYATAALALLVLSGCNGQTPSTQCSRLGVPRSDELKVLETVLQSDGANGVEILNSRVVVNTSGIRILRQDGMKSVPALVSLLCRDELSFDTFVRCYSAAEQILKAENPDTEVPWDGGAEIVPTENGGFRLEPRGQMQLRKFRHKIASHIARAYVDVQDVEARSVR
jgi:hypothetical protein